MIGCSILVSGKVQGVFYRASTAEEAKRLGVTGWVKNLPSGEVLIEAFGIQEQVEALAAWCKQGPPLSEVNKVTVQEISFREESSFRVVYL
ncbi:acylphosphatase [Reichenbachiella sp.]|uniref:acylphosphatase n=1 Tax=Reichenbachiella sp. TaxID=2184521 RepID=UPI003B593208